MTKERVTKKPKDDAEASVKPIWIICFQRVSGAPKPPFVVKTTLTKANFFETEYGALRRSVCSTATYLTEEAADAQLSSYKKLALEVNI